MADDKLTDAELAAAIESARDLIAAGGLPNTTVLALDNQVRLAEALLATRAELARAEEECTRIADDFHASLAERERQGREDGAARERAAVVAWLTSWADDLDSHGDYGDLAAMLRAHAVTGIEAGRHLTDGGAVGEEGL